MPHEGDPNSQDSLPQEERVLVTFEDFERDPSYRALLQRACLEWLTTSGADAFFREYTKLDDDGYLISNMSEKTNILPSQLLGTEKKSTEWVAQRIKELKRAEILKDSNAEAAAFQHFLDVNNPRDTVFRMQQLLEGPDFTRDGYAPNLTAFANYGGYLEAMDQLRVQAHYVEERIKQTTDEKQKTQLERLLKDINDSHDRLERQNAIAKGIEN